MLTERILLEYPEDCIALCYDTGHEYQSGESFKILESLGNRLVTMHVHDNHGGYDEHLLPYEGTIDWSMFASIMKKIDYSGNLLLEAIKTDEDGFKGPREFLKEARKRADKLIGEITG